MTTLSRIYSREEWHNLVLNNREYAERLATGEIVPKTKPEVVYIKEESTPSFKDARTDVGVSFDEYSKMVWKVTNKQPLHLLPHYKKRGFNNYHLDHRISIWLGWKSSIAPEIIGDFTNLKMIPAKENLKKGKSGKI